MGGCRGGGVGDDGGVADIKRGRAARNAKLASIPAGFVGRAALGFGKRLTGKSRDEVNAELMEKAANQLFSVLGELKGGAMKVGQALSVMEAAVPEEFGEPYREALTKLQKDAPPLPAAKVHRVLDGQLGTKWRTRFSSFDDQPVASASIGQVHRAVWHDGRDVAVKIQYPGADEALRADLKTMQRMVSVFKQLSPGADVRGVVDELIERTEMELDYRLEAENQRAFAKAYAGDPHFLVPHVVASSPKVMITDWTDGVPMAQIIRSGTVDQRDLCGTRLLELTFGAPARVGMMHGDAHPGNFMLLDDGRMAVIDFGAVAPLPDGLPVELGMIIRLARDKNYDLLLPTMEKVGFIQKGEQVPPKEIDDMLRQYVEPIQVEVFHYTRKWLQKMAAVNMSGSVEQIKTARQMDLPAKLAMPLRVIASIVAISAQLDAHVPVRALAEQLIPGFAEPEPVH
ncbi:macrolide-binding ATPase MABP-1 [Candidatus Mycolicibacterium alkanivorans]|uniref:Phosphotransferase n=1 Tax=Candidatus Mycolicibacterium alkanivorans TaxID=2954114 RepID=A0ABS9YZW7_9MYCO|nr:AarF/UbiB family protein [Candidatus Mycolicibacterium alkanivorans]MCI4676755.1 phosphotransferase [Candidatus Mycolicibacterium alkanivorans]